MVRERQVIDNTLDRYSYIKRRTDRKRVDETDSKGETRGKERNRDGREHNRPTEEGREKRNRRVFRTSEDSRSLQPCRVRLRSVV